MQAIVVKAPAGLGKTREFAKLVAGVGGVIEVYVPTNRLAEEWRDCIHRFNPGKRVQLVRGRSAIRQPARPPGTTGSASMGSGAAAQGLALCAKHKLAEEVSKAGLAVYPNLCRRSRGRGVAPVKCQHHDYCDYLGQFHPAEVYIFTHAHLPLERGVLETWTPSLVIIDESFFQNMLAEFVIPMSLLTHSGMPAAARNLCGDVASALAARRSMQTRFAAALGPNGDFAPALQALKVSPAIDPADSEAQQRVALRQTVSFDRVIKLLTQLAVESQVRAISQSAVFDAASGNIVLHHRRTITRFDRANGTQPKVFILDASASRQIIGQFFQVAQFHCLDVRRNAHVVQCHSTRCSTTSLVASKNPNVKAAVEATHRIAELNLLIAKLATNGTKVLVVGPVAVVGNLAKGQPALLAVPAHCELAHFNSLRGVDRWKGFDIVVVVGRNEPPVLAIENIARALYFSDSRDLVLPGAWDYQVRGYRVAGAPLGVETAVHADSRVQEVAEQLREHESLQAIDRLRLMHNANKKTVIVLSNVPLDIDVDEARTWDELMQGSRLERAWGSCPGVLPLNPVWLATTFPRLWRSAEAAKLDVDRTRKKGHFSNICSIRKVTLFGFEYKTATQRRWSKCLSALDSTQHVDTMLKGLIGEPVNVRPNKVRP